MERKTFYNIVIHSVIWIVYFSLPLFILPKPSEFLYSTQVNLITYVVLTTLSIVFFYLNYSLTIPGLLFKRRYIPYFFSVVGFIAIAVIITIAIVLWLLAGKMDEIEPPDLARSYIIRFLVILGVSLILRYQQRIKQLSSDRIKSELSFLKAQINPHFLFNTLNGIYGQAMTKSNETADSIAKLSTMMRYVLTETNKELVPLDNEIQYLRGYIDLQMIRLTEKSTIKFSTSGDIHGVQIPPLLFISFIENAFKHGISNETESTITIDISVDGVCVSLNVANSKIDIETYTGESHNIGMENTKRRLDLIYANRYTLDINEDSNTYEVKLKICQK